MIRLLFLCALSVSSLSAAHNELSAKERADGWRLLFDGHSFQGWKASARSDSFTIDNGAIKANRRPRFREDLESVESFEDFELTFEWRISPAGNSGVKYRVQDAAIIHPSWIPPAVKHFERQVDYAIEHPIPRERMPDDGRGQIYVVAFEYQVIDNGGHSDSKGSQESWAGSLYQLAGPEKDTTRPVGEWNQARIVVRGRHTEHWLNGYKTVDVSLDAKEIHAGLELRWTKESAVYRLLTGLPRPRGPLVLQNHNDEAWFRDLKIRPLR